MPDTLLAAAAAEKQTNTAAEPSAGLETPAGYATTDLTAVGEGRETVRCYFTFFIAAAPMHVCHGWPTISILRPALWQNQYSSHPTRLHRSSA